VRVLVVEDDVDLATALAKGLRHEEFAVDVSGDGGDALDKASYNDYDAVVLDRDLPVVHGDEVCATLASRDNPPRILMLTAMGQLADRVGGLTLGADDYLAKPFELAEVVARLHALARRPSRSSAPVLRHDEIELDTGARTASRGGRQLTLTRKEFGVLEVLMRADGDVVSAETLLEKVWDEHADPFTNAIRITMVTLRKKLGDPPPIETVTGAGYRLS
jgi:DNA-binding response OmpR family regulator